MPKPELPWEDLPSDEDDNVDGFGYELVDFESLDLPQFEAVLASLFPDYDTERVTAFTKSVRTDWLTRNSRQKAILSALSLLIDCLVHSRDEFSPRGELYQNARVLLALDRLTAAFGKKPDSFQKLTGYTLKELYSAFGMYNPELRDDEGP